MPQFAPGVAKTAIAPIVAKPSGMSCEAELFLGPNEVTKVVTSGRIPFVSTGAAKNVNLPTTMPGSPGSYHGYIDVFTGGFRFLAYILKEDVVIAAPALGVNFGPLTGQVSTCREATAYKTVELWGTIINPHAVEVTQNITIWACYWNRYYGNWYPSEAGAPATYSWIGGNPNPIQVIIPAGGSVPFHLPAYTYSEYGESCTSWWGMYKDLYYWLQDDLGNKSNRCFMPTPG